MPSLLQRIQSAGKALLGRESRSFAPVEMWQGEYGIGHSFKPTESLRAHGDNPWLRSSVNRVAFEIAQTKFKLRNASGEKEMVEKHQVLETIKKPQPVDGGKSLLTSMDLWFVTSQHMMLNGEAFWLLMDRVSERMGGGPRQIMPLLPSGIRVVTDKQGMISSYKYRLPDRELTINPIDLVHFKVPDPENWYRGQSPVKAIRYSVDTYHEADQMNAKRLKNYAVPSGLLESDKQITEDDIKKLREQWRNLYGGAENAGKVAVLPHGLKFNKVQESLQEMQFIEGKNVSRDEILANYGVGLEILGRTESQTRANAETAVYVFMRFGVLPYLAKICDTLNNDLLPAFPGTEGLEFYYDDPVPENMEEKRLNSQALMDNAALTPDEMRQMFGMEPLDIPGVTDVPYAAFSKVPAISDPALNDPPLG